MTKKEQRYKLAKEFMLEFVRNHLEDHDRRIEGGQKPVYIGPDHWARCAVAHADALINALEAQ